MVDSCSVDQNFVIVLASSLKATGIECRRQYSFHSIGKLIAPYDVTCPSVERLDLY